MGAAMANYPELTDLEMDELPLAGNGGIIGPLKIDVEIDNYRAESFSLIGVKTAEWSSEARGWVYTSLAKESLLYRAIWDAAYRNKLTKSYIWEAISEEMSEADFREEMAILYPPVSYPLVSHEAA